MEAADERALTRSRARILVVDDEHRILRFVARGLQAEGFEVDSADNGAEALRRALATDYDLVVLDLLMPGMDGATVLSRLLAARPRQAVIVLSCLTATATKVRCLEAGAEDYLAKPFSLDELLARVRARLRAAAGRAATELVAGRLRLDLIRREAHLGAGPVALAEREFLLLRELMEHADRTLSKQRLLAAVWHYHFDPGSNVVDVYVRRLRAKLGAEAVVTVRGEGYRIATQ
ncbi:MAG TPA: response regulator transcription factor [Actinomycetes bacterium]|nr:response regulator transcription factor [Actinomycetes bacterium]